MDARLREIPLRFPGRHDETVRVPPAGRWQLARTAKSTTAEVIAFEPFSAKLLRAVDAEVADIARFLDTAVSLTFS